VVSNGRHDPEMTPAPPFHPGILRIHPCDDNGLDDHHDAFAGLGFPTLIITYDAPPQGPSAHERLELCAALGDRMAADCDALRL